MNIKLIIALCVVALVNSAGSTKAQADDWPQFRGEGGVSVASAKLPTTFDDQANVAWKLPMPAKGASSPIVVGDKVIVTPGHIRAMMVALDKKTGEEVWKTQGGRIGPIGADGAAYSSVVVTEIDGTRQYVQLVGRGVMGVRGGLERA